MLETEELYQSLFDHFYFVTVGLRGAKTET